MIQDKLDNMLIDACRLGYLELVKSLVEDGANIHEHKDVLLCFPSVNRHLDIVKYLVEQGADTHAFDDYALLMIFNYGNKEILKVLLNKIGEDNNMIFNDIYEYYFYLGLKMYKKRHNPVESFNSLGIFGAYKDKCFESFKDGFELATILEEKERKELLNQ